MLLDIKDPAGFNYPELGDIIVTDGHNPERRDIQFEGPPTIDMEPIDDEARKITQSYIDSGAWKKPTDNEPHGEGLIKRFMEEIAKAQSTGPISASAVGAKEFADLQEQVKALMEQNAKLLATKLDTEPGVTPAGRRGL
jgi:hypothetical protein